MNDEPKLIISNPFTHVRVVQTDEHFAVVESDGRELATFYEVIYANYMVDALNGRDELLRQLRQVTAEREQLTRERDLAVAHDRQPYPTAHAYDKVCDALSASKSQLERLKANALKSPSQVCREQQVQNCHFCDRMDCCDNTSEAKKQIEQLQQALAEKDRCYRVLVIEKHEQAAEYEKELEATSNQMQELRYDLSDAQGDIGLLKELNRSHCKQIEQLQQENQEHLQQIAKLASFLKECRLACRAEQARADGLIVQNDRLQQKFHDAENRVPTKWWCCTADYPNHDAKCPNNTERLRARLEAKDAKIADLRQELDVAKARFDRVRSERDILQQENVTLKTAISTPEVYAGVIDKVVAEERERLAKTAADLRLENERLKAILDRIGLYCFMPDSTPDEVAQHMQHVAESHLAQERTLRARIADLERLLLRSADFMQSAYPPRPMLIREIRRALPPRACVHDPETMVDGLLRCRLCHAVRLQGLGWGKWKCRSDRNANEDSQPFSPQPAGDQEATQP